ncbi:NUDIX domain-containing protein [Pseudomonas sp. GD03842]|uniref:NUDIX hydrolase n=1 Tax=Pseudomonas sp. GD03842 TaxID=2975385 RepID=UPI00244B2C4F|nr:NUDIX domain-containing protein [Pseudomonas sp. GD03842]MDH0748579.1 NUDIX domain-containing protein [Pseudomonas sp. GD03842]
MKVIRIAAALLIGADGRTLLVRKRGTQAFMQPGGKIDPGESAAQALGRELNEELGLVVDVAQAQFLGEFSAVAANEPGFEVNCQLYRLDVDQAVNPAAEIEEILWVDGGSLDHLHLAPLTRDSILPLYRSLQLA